jgi:2-polyprenyl-3-methyl-5-hydroxy-6-metoxy-1,4-benzoquinol methylase
MATVGEHYDKVLSDVYSWMLGGFENAIQRNVEFINKHKLTPHGSGIAIDLGSGCGFQSISLAKAGYSVTAIDIDAKLLDELRNNCGELQIEIIRDDLINFDKTTQKEAELIVCMTDTILHLESKEKVILLFDKVFRALEPKGKFILTFRDLTHELNELDRFIPVKSDENTIFTCFLEYETETVKVHDLVYKKSLGEWELLKSFYRKLRLSEDWIGGKLLDSGFTEIDSEVENGFVTVVAGKEAK